MRYTRLQQGPVKFTFTAEGETLDENDMEDETNKEEEEMASFTTFPLPGNEESDN